MSLAQSEPLDQASFNEFSVHVQTLIIASWRKSVITNAMPSVFRVGTAMYIIQHPRAIDIGAGVRTFPTSFRPRSTSMMCSEHSLPSANSSFSRRLSSSIVVPLRRVPARGLQNLPKGSLVWICIYNSVLRSQYLEIQT